jgi:hypothetical protein
MAVSDYGCIPNTRLLKQDGSFMQIFSSSELSADVKKIQELKTNVIKRI